MTVKQRGVDLINSHAPKMNKHEVPSFYGSLANNTTKGLRSGFIIFGKNPICQHSTNMSELIVMQVPCRSGLYLKHEPNAKTLLLDVRMMAFLMQLTVTSAAPILLSQCVNTDQLKTECRRGKSWLTSLNFSFLDGDDEGAFIIPAMLAHKSSVSKIAETELENRCSNLPLLEMDHCFVLVAPDSCVLGSPGEVLQRILSQANKVNVCWPPFGLVAFLPPGV